MLLGRGNWSIECKKTVTFFETLVLTSSQTLGTYIYVHIYILKMSHSQNNFKQPIVDSYNENLITWKGHYYLVG